MPWYEYRCSICGEKYDVVLTIAERDHSISPCCGDLFPAKVISAGAFIIDGVMATTHPNSPDGMQRIKEVKQKHWKKGKKNHDEWKKENIIKAKKDKVWKPVE